MVTTGVEEQERRSEKTDAHRCRPVTVHAGGFAADDRAPRVYTEGKEWTWTPDPTEAQAPVDAGPAPCSSRVDDLIRVFAWAKMLGG